ncbi:5-methylcytosine-specific restriction protein B [Hymenobacter luteus]|uniref:5-methylcytosine-specific restriction protein B n=2 Tax=Hymenobacter TaxID=89966 RepID=A0A7W9WBC9_9BACT|nr:MULTISPECIES: AAA family ATPase [Hymenobacter]MBB4600925.1 5-methylcytosine-specific restriction protein B [Hymenobacter latericoloratus]MBB6058868.1 5-methylcytosine-specific restriction protein B [Hymenobacter luteus]
MNTPVYFALGTMQAPNGQLVDMTADFLAKGYWSHDHDGKVDVEKRVRSIPVGAMVALKSSFVSGKKGHKVGMLRIKGLGTVTHNPGDGMRVEVQWQPDVKPFELPVGYRHTISRVNSSENVQAIFHGKPLPVKNQQTTVTPDKPQTEEIVHPLNQILYGPPGTGKTHATMAWTIALLEGREFAEVVDAYDDKRQELLALVDDYRQRGQVEFVTFHQSFSYEDFVEGIKPEPASNGQLNYAVADGVFKRLAREARKIWQAQQDGKADSAPLVAEDTFDESYAAYLDSLSQQLQKGQRPRLNTRQGHPADVLKVDADGTLILEHVNSAQMKHRIGREWIRGIYAKYDQPDDIQQVYRELRLLGGPNVSLQWAIFKGLKDFEAARRPATPNAEAAEIAPLSKLAGEAPRYVLIVDEINRGNVANIFGELITLLEEDKRVGGENELTLTLPYSKTGFKVPPNLYLLGTMNTADRSVEALDTALRRRFGFVEMLPQPELLDPLGEPTDAQHLDLSKLLRVINERLEYLLDRDHQLGHAWLLEVTDLDDLRRVFRNKVIPQLQEYFHGRWGRIGQVLGADFVEVKTSTVQLMPGFDDDLDGGEERSVYHIPLDKDWSEEAFRRIYQTT